MMRRGRLPDIRQQDVPAPVMDALLWKQQRDSLKMERHRLLTIITMAIKHL